MSCYRPRMLDKAALYNHQVAHHPNNHHGPYSNPNIHHRLGHHPGHRRLHHGGMAEMTVKHEYSPSPPVPREYPSPDNSVYTPSPPPHYSYSPPMSQTETDDTFSMQHLHRWYSEKPPSRYGSNIDRTQTKMVLNMPQTDSLGLPLDPSVTVKMEPVGSPDDFSNLSSGHSPCSSFTIESPSPTIKPGKRKKGHGTAGKSIEEELCLICGDRASGYHYNALSCEGCKGFFRRSITKDATYKCKNSGDCEMDMWMRRRCQFCRLRRCREVGMKEECLLSEEQCKARDVRRKARTPSKKEPEKDVVKAKASTNFVEDTVSDNPLEKMTPEYRRLLEIVVTYQDQYELPSDDDLKKITQIRISDLGRPKDLSEVIYKSMAEMTILVTHLVVEFAKRLPDFDTLNGEDQILLLKSSASEVMILRTARRYDVDTDTIVFGDGTPYTRENMRFGGLGDWVDDMFAFCKTMGLMSVDNAEYALLTSICIFADRPGLIDPLKVEHIQSQYTATLYNYDMYRRPRASQHFAKLLVKLADLRTLSSSHKDILSTLKVEKGPLPPLLGEFFDVV